MFFPDNVVRTDGTATAVTVLAEVLAAASATEATRVYFPDNVVRAADTAAAVAVLAAVVAAASATEATRVYFSDNVVRTADTATAVAAANGAGSGSDSSSSSGECMLLISFFVLLSVVQRMIDYTSRSCEITSDSSDSGSGSEAA
jgi:hypothetical protein